MKNGLPKIQQDGSALASQKIDKPVAAYNKIRGPIKYSAAERKEWEGEMFRTRGLGFKSEAYPKTN